MSWSRVELLQIHFHRSSIKMRYRSYKCRFSSTSVFNILSIFCFKPMEESRTFPTITWTTHKIENGSEMWVSLSSRNAFLANTLDPEGFQKYISDAMKSREAHVVKKRNLNMKMVSKVARIFEMSQNVAGKPFDL